jgi:hypothetical protein
MRAALLMALFFLCSAMQMELRQQSSEPNLSHPQQEQGDQTDSHSTMEILPASYLGCWRGVVTGPDTLQTLNGCLNGPSVPELYTLCYRKSLTGKFEVTFGEVEMDSEVPVEYRVSGTSGKVEVVSSDGLTRVRLRSFIHFDQKQVDTPSGSDSVWAMDEHTEMDCEIKNGDMQVRGAFTETSDGGECFKGTWHARFRRFED